MGSHRVGHDWSDLATAAAAEVKYGLEWKHRNYGTIDIGKVNIYL